jgi:Flp pilus assembly protein TadD
MQNRLEESVAQMRAALAISPHAKSHLNLGITLMRMGDERGATAAFEEAIRKNPLYARPHAMLATLKLKAGDLAGAESHVARALRLSPNDSAARQAAEAVAAARRGGGAPGRGE